MSECQENGRQEPPRDALPEEWDDFDEGASEAWEEIAENDFDEPEPDWDDFDAEDY